MKTGFKISNVIYPRCSAIKSAQCPYWVEAIYKVDRPTK
jgi:hypothetical protein